MKTISARIPDELFIGLQQFCADSSTNVNRVVAQAIQATIRGKVELKPLGGRDICPRCAHTVHLVQDDSKLYFACFNCDWAGYLGKYSLPSKIDDLQGKLLEKEKQKEKEE